MASAGSSTNGLFVTTTRKSVWFGGLGGNLKLKITSLSFFIGTFSYLQRSNNKEMLRRLEIIFIYICCLVWQNVVVFIHSLSARVDSTTERRNEAAQILCGRNCLGLNNRLSNTTDNYVGKLTDEAIIENDATARSWFSKWSQIIYPGVTAHLNSPIGSEITSRSDLCSSVVGGAELNPKSAATLR